MKNNGTCHSFKLLLSFSCPPSERGTDLLFFAPQMEHSFSFFKILHTSYFTLKVCMRIEKAKP